MVCKSEPRPMCRPTGREHRDYLEPGPVSLASTAGAIAAWLIIVPVVAIPVLLVIKLFRWTFGV